MASALKGEVPLVLGDQRALTLVFDMEALIEAETVYGKPLHAIVIDASAGFMGATRALLYGALRRHHPQTTISDVSKLLASDGDAISQALATAHEAAMPKTSAEGKAGRAPAARRRGKTSGDSGVKSA